MKEEESRGEGKGGEVEEARETENTIKVDENMKEERDWGRKEGRMRSVENRIEWSVEKDMHG